MEENDILTPAEEVEFEVVTRKKKGKRNSKGSRSHVPNQPHPNQSRNQKSYYRNGKRSSFDNIIYGEPYDINKEFHDMSMIHTDASMSAAPKYEETQKAEEEIEDNKELSPIIIEEVPPTEEPVEEKFNKRALSKFAATYELEKFEKNALLILNHKNVDGYKTPRLGTEQDVAVLESTFKNYGFEIEIEHDLKRDEIMEKLKEFTSRDFTDYGCIGIAVLTHGSRDGRIKAKDMAYSEVEIISHLQVRDKPTMVTKPRIVIIQACRGTKSIKAVPVGVGYRTQTDLEEEVEPYTLPVESDMLVLHSSYIGKVSHRHELHGSWFIQALCNKISQLSATVDLEAILTEVKRDVAIDKEHQEWNRRTYEYDVNKQMPVSTSTLIRKLYFKKFGDSPESECDHRTLATSSSSQNLQITVDNSGPSTPMLMVQHGSCSCFLNHFVYIRDCLSYFVLENPSDARAAAYLTISNTFEDGELYNSAKEEMAKLICDHMRAHGKDHPYFKFLYFYKH